MVTNNSINNTVADNDFSVNRSTAGTATVLSVNHSDNTNTSSNAVLDLTVGGTSGGDASVHFSDGTNEFYVGLDTSTPSFKIGPGSSPSGSYFFERTANGWQYFFGSNAGTTTNQFQFGSTNAGKVNLLKTYNNSTTASSAAQMASWVEGAGSADPSIAFRIGSISANCMGIDNSDADKLKITYDSAGGPFPSPSGGVTQWEMTTAGERTMPLQPAFLAYMSANAPNVTGDGTYYTIAANTEIFDQNADYDNTTYTFTAPVTGRYHLNAIYELSSATASHTDGQYRIVTSNGDYYNTDSPATRKISTGGYRENISMLVDMDAADTASFSTQTSGSTKTMGVVGGSREASVISGYLVC